MNDEEIKAEASRRLANMSDKEKLDMWDLSDENKQFVDYVSKHGQDGLSENDRRKFRRIKLSQISQTAPGGLSQSAIESRIKEQFNISRYEIKNMKKNPYKAKIFKSLLMTILMNVGAAGLAFGGLAAPALALETTAGVFAMSFARQVKNYFDFKKLKKKYVTGEIDEDYIKAEMFKQMLEEDKNSILGARGRRL